MAEIFEKPYISYAEYRALEEKTETKHEWLNGQIFDMEALGRARESIKNAARIANLLGEIGAQLHHTKCAGYASLLRLRVRATGLATYPDLTVVCGKPEVDAEDSDAVVNPTALFEVLSPTSEAYDRGAKFAHYRRIPSLRDYVMVNCSERRIEVYHRSESGRWELTEAVAGESIEVTSIGVRLSVDEVYADSLSDAAAG